MLRVPTGIMWKNKCGLWGKINAGKTGFNKNKLVSLMLDFFEMQICTEHSKSLRGMVCFLNLLQFLRN
jgi:hypothetical protein